MSEVVPSLALNAGVTHDSTSFTHAPGYASATTTFCRNSRSRRSCVFRATCCPGVRPDADVEAELGSCCAAFYDLSLSCLDAGSAVAGPPEITSSTSTVRPAGSRFIRLIGAPGPKALQRTCASPRPKMTLSSAITCSEGGRISPNARPSLRRAGCEDDEDMIIS